MKIIVTGGAGFIGSTLIRYLLGERDYEILNVDKLTYAANLDNLIEIRDHKKYSFLQGDICNEEVMSSIFSEFEPNIVFNLAAESHVDRSIDNPESFVETNIRGTFRLLQTALRYYQTLPTNQAKKFRFIHVSTDEVFGSLDIGEPSFDRKKCYDPLSPYSASKAASDHLVRAWHNTYGLPIIITSCSNNYGPFQFPEKFIPHMIINGLRSKVMPLYGNGSNIRDWLHVNDHCKALLMVAENGKIGQTYLMGGNEEWTNLEVLNLLCKILDGVIPQKNGKRYSSFIECVEDRPGHDFRYSINISQTTDEIGWVPEISLEQGLYKTIEWYIKNQKWWKKILRQKYTGGRLGMSE